MLLFIILLLIIFILGTIVLGVASAIGAGVFLVFGDVIICIILIIFVIKKIFFKRK